MPENMMGLLVGLGCASCMAFASLRNLIGLVNALARMIAEIRKAAAMFERRNRK